jgi:hypothetical protein
MQYFASHIPIMTGSTVLAVGKKGKTREIKEVDAFKLKTMMSPGDELWLMMGSTNAVVAAAAYELGVKVMQISYPRALSALNGKEAEKSEGEVSRRHKFTPQDIQTISQRNSELFYTLTITQTDVLKIIAAWQNFKDAMEVRKRYGNTASARIRSQAAIYGYVLGREVTDGQSLKELLSDQFDTKDGSGKRRKPSDPRFRVLVETEEQAGRQLDQVIKSSGLFRHIFGEVEGIGSRLGARIIAAIENIERFKEPKDLSNFAGLLPRGPEGKLPSRRHSRGKMLSRNPDLNTAGFLFQNQISTYGRRTELGQKLVEQIQLECPPCTAEERKKDKELRTRYAGAVTKARIAMTCYLLEDIVWPRWRQYFGYPC